ncbi:MAG: cyclase family protein [Bacteroidota bacterium]
MRQLQLRFQEKEYIIQLNKKTSIAIPLIPNQENVSCYYAEQPKAEIIRSGDFVGSVAEGGSVNYRTLLLTPHGNGTHTECYGHISDDRFTMIDCDVPTFLIAQLVTVSPVKRGEDYIITWGMLQHQITTPTPEALIIRTLPNGTDKLKRAYSGTNPPYLDPEVGQKLREHDIKHLLVDLPSVDREEDEGRLSVHKGFWNFPRAPRINSTITELIFVPNHLSDGIYVLNLQLPRIALDAVPSQPIIYPLQ